MRWRRGNTPRPSASPMFTRPHSDHDTAVTLAVRRAQVSLAREIIHPHPYTAHIVCIPYIYVERTAGIHPSQKSQKPREKSLDLEPPVSIWDRFCFGAGHRRSGVLPKPSKFATQKPTLPPKKTTHLCRLCPKTTKILFRMILNSVDN
jgi:hypothetical protein